MDTRLKLLAIVFHLNLQLGNAITCHECGNMYDGTSFMGIEDFKECQFFEHDIADDNQEFLVQCPPDDMCCFALREHLTMEFWGHAAAAEVLVRGCCSKLNQTKHHLASAKPPPLVTDMKFRAEILSQTVQNDAVKTRVLFCNTMGCNNQRVPWSKPVIMDAKVSENVRSLAPVSNKSKPKMSSAATAITPRPKMREPSMARRQTVAEEQNLLALFEKFRNSALNDNEEEDKTAEDINDMENEDSDYEEANMMKRPMLKSASNANKEMSFDEGNDKTNHMVPSTMMSKMAAATSQNDPFKCECNCNCPSLVCPTFQISSSSRDLQDIPLVLPYCLSLLFREYFL